MSDTKDLQRSILNMNNKLKEQGFNERERAFMWGKTVAEARIFLTEVWEALHNDKNPGHTGKEKTPNDHRSASERSNHKSASVQGEGNRGGSGATS